jgi:hypothetical protein
VGSNRYSFLSRWRVEGTPEEVFPIMADWTEMPRWWPSVVLRVDVLRPGDADGVGKLVQLCTHGWLPYVVRSQVEIVERTFPHRLRCRTGGELRGEATWTVRADGPFVDLVADWTVIAEKPLIKYLSFALGPLFAWNHNWAMRRGEESIRLEVARCRARTEAARQVIPAPPRPNGLWRWKGFQLGLPA